MSAPPTTTTTGYLVLSERRRQGAALLGLSARGRTDGRWVEDEPNAERETVLACHTPTHDREKGAEDVLRTGLVPMTTENKCDEIRLQGLSGNSRSRTVENVSSAGT